jgi:hypothetical protein
MATISRDRCGCRRQRTPVNVHPQYFQLRGNASTKLIELLSTEGVEVDHPSFQMHRALSRTLRLYYFARHWTKVGDSKLVRLESELLCLDFRDGILPCQRREFFYLLPHLQGRNVDVISGSRARLSAVFVSSNRPSITSSAEPRRKKWAPGWCCRLR